MKLNLKWYDRLFLFAFTLTALLLYASAEKTETQYVGTITLPGQKSCECRITHTGSLEIYTDTKTEKVWAIRIKD